jgi:hypothetical protein
MKQRQDIPNPIPEAVFLQKLFGKIFEISFGEGNI